MKLHYIPIFISFILSSISIAQPSASFTISSSSGCVDDTVTFTDTSTPNGDPIVSYDWDFGDGNTSLATNPSHTYNLTGSYTITLIITDTNGLTDIATQSYTVNSPTSNFVANPQIGCTIPHTVFFTDQSTLPDTWSWDFGDGNTSTLQNPIHTYTSYDDFMVTLTVRDTINGCQDAITRLIQVAQVDTDFIANGSTFGAFGCGPLNVDFEDTTTTSSNASINGWEWDLGDGTTSNLQNPTHIYQTPGIYNVSLTTTLAETGCTNTETKNAFVQVIGPDVDFSTTSATTGPTPLTVDFTDNTIFGAPIIAWNWDFGDGNTSSLQNPSHTYLDCSSFDVSLTVTDIDGCSRTETKENYIITTDNEAPTAVCQNITVQLDEFGQATITADQLDGGSTDNCATTLTFDASQTTFTCDDLNGGGAPLPPLLITGVVDADLTGGTPKALELKVQEDIADLSLYGFGSANNGGGSDGEEFTFPADAVTAGTFIYITTDNDQFFEFFGFNADYINGAIAINGDDAVELFFNGAVIDTFGDINVNGDGEVWEYTDGWASRINNTGPDGTVFTPANWNYSGPTALEDETTNATSANPFPIGSYTAGTAGGNGEVMVTLTVTDENGNSDMCEATVTVQDMIAPTIFCPNPVIVNSDTGLCEASGVALGAPFVNDNCSASITVTNNAPAVFPVGTTEVTWFAEDEYGNTSSCIQMVTVEDNELPEAVCQNITIELDANGEASITAEMLNNGSTDNCEIGSVTASQENFTCADLGENEVQLFIADVNGNIADCTATVTVEDNIAPTLVCLNPTVELDGDGMAVITFMDLVDPVNSSDNCGIVDGTLSMDTFTCVNLGDNEVILTVVDASGNEAMCTATVTVVSNSLPVAVCQNITVVLDETGQATIDAEDVDGGSEASTCGDLTFEIDVTTFSCDNLGENTVTLTVTDNQGNMDTCEATVTVTEETAPDVVCQNITVALDDNGMVMITADAVDNGSTDNCGAVVLTIDIDSFDCTNIGENEVTLTATDTSGNASSCIAIVTVEDVTPPMAVCQDLTIFLDEDGQASITVAQINNGSNDACGISEVSIDTTDFDCDDFGDNIVTLTVTDVNGNSSTCEATVTVMQNNAAPVAMCQNITIVLDENGLASITTANIDAGSLGEGCDNGLVIDMDTFTCDDIGLNEVTLTVTNGNGESASCIAFVNVVDNLDPVIICPEETVIIAAKDPYELPDFVANGTIIIEDNCGGNLTISQDPEVGTIVGAGETDIEITVTDPSGNEDSCEFTILVDPSLGIDESVSLTNTLSLYPNPVSSFVVLENPNSIELRDAKLIDITGRIVKTFNLNNTSVERILDISEIASARYFLIIEGTEGTATFQVIKR